MRDGGCRPHYLREFCMRESAARAAAAVPVRTVGSKFMPSYIPEASDKVDTEGINKFETAAHDTAVAQQDVTYGLHVRARPQEGAEEWREQQEQQPAAVPADREAAKLKEDLDGLPPEADLDAYAAMPVDQFGMALLRGMGWTEGAAIGRNAKEEVKAKELVRRPQRLGLGAAPAPEQANKKFIKPGESRDRPDLVYVDSQGVQRSSKPVDEKLVERRREGVHPGKARNAAALRDAGVCDVYVDDIKESVLDLHQRQLETVVPSTEGTPVLVLAGRLRGKQGRLLKRNTETGLAAVQLTGDFSVHKLGLDDVSEYTGPTDAWDAE
ncbi:hypothetical protein CHLNCDRAFT_53994 [Chlorella variabilis]|uniref:G-patch domain-containing protein n=1 Tax=Chlorella variabilis TaxID=554065 RepID=E1ZM27_CHLVA|nr:hypothetical protein CHLNCDRAFT_53994 [Chlorella variabilis]EFN53037.1 hypothetical protein CHLNCDRAFT_53994 [Chlorella variabilis]|eukprot:XP_005845139.1 hypothetical protein CHLNCDRAFT_53994 [Chlorella variabilis]